MAERSGREHGLRRETLKNGLGSPTRLGALTAILIVLIAAVTAVIAHAPAAKRRVVAVGAAVGPTVPSEPPAAVVTTELPTTTTTTSPGRQTTTTALSRRRSPTVAATPTAVGSDVATTTTTQPPPPVCTISQLAFSMTFNGRQYQPSSPPAYLSGDGMALSTLAVNISSQPCTLDAYPCDAAALVQDAQGTTIGDVGPMPDLGSPCPFPTTGHTLGPGESSGLSTLFDVNPQPPLPAGHYFARSLWLINGVHYTGSPVALDLRQVDDGTRVLTTTQPYPETVS